ncbi:MAG: TolC family protein [Bacteroides sp.]|nr:TolC family protein [Bacteroides sp.]
MIKMKSFIGKKMLLLSLLLMVITVASAQDTSGGVLRVDLNQALEIALDENPTIQVADMEVQKKKYAEKEALSQLFPIIDASGTFSHTIKKQSFAMEGNVVKVGSKNTWQGGFNLALPVFAPSLYQSIQLTDTDVYLAVESARASRLDLINEVTKAFFQVLLVQDSYEVLLQSYQQAQRNFEVVNNKYIQGVVSEYDKIRAEVQVHNLKPSVVSAENAVNLTKLQLQVLMGIDTEYPLEVTGNLAEHEKELYAEVLSIDTSLESNSDLRQIELQRKMLDQTVKLNKTAFMPTLAFSAQYSWMTMADNMKFRNYNWSPYSTIGFSLSVPLVNISNVFKVKQAKVSRAQIDYTTTNLRRTLDMQVKSYMDNMQNSIQQIDSNKEGVRQAEKGQTIAQKMYEVGSGTILELNDSEVALTQARLAYNQSIFDYLSSRSDLEKVLGRGVE